MTVVPLIEPKEVAVMIPAVTLPTVMSSSELLRVTLPVLPYSPVTHLMLHQNQYDELECTPSLGAAVNVSVLSVTLYALDVEVVVGY